MDHYKTTAHASGDTACNSTVKLPAHLRRRVAVTASCDERTVAKFVRGGSVMPLTRERIESALRQHGLSHLIG